MGAMTAVPATEGFTRADLDAMPDDGRRYELIDGAILVTPPPSTRHQDVVGNLFLLLKASAPRELKVVVAPFAVTLATGRVIEPDVVVARRSDVTERDLPAAPVLAVEVLSSSTQWVDLGRKKTMLAESGCRSYWLVDPGQAATQPSLTVLELAEDGGYVEVAQVSGSASWTAELPFEVTVTPVELLDD
jgi:Uma2 family endonuclease